MYTFNEYQTPFVAEEFPDQEIAQEIVEALEGIQFIKNLVSVDRKRACEVYRKDYEYINDDGTIRIENKIVPNISEPHILEDMDYFRPAAIHFEKHKKYTLHNPNPHPDSEYTKFWREEKRRCLEGYVRPSDGEWIPGYFYFYLNYVRIMKPKGKQKSKDGKVKRAERVEAFPDFWDGDYWYFHYLEQCEENGQFAVVLKARGRGYSYKGGALGSRNYLHIAKSASFLMAHDLAYLEGDGIWSKSMDILDWSAKHTPFPRLRAIDKQSEMTIRSGYKVQGRSDIMGYKSLLQGIGFQHNANKARGIRGKLIEWEEAGKFPKLLDAWGIAESSLLEGDTAFGLMIAFGTGGSEEADFEALESLFRSPHTYHIMGIPNVYDSNADPSVKVGFFMPEYINRRDCFDENGNSDVIKALIQIFKARKLKKATDTDPFAIVREKAERPITPIEAMMRKTGTFFPVNDITEKLTAIRTNFSKFVAPHYPAELTLTDGKVKYKYSSDIPIREYPYRGVDKSGCIEIFNQPQKGRDGKVFPGRYIIGVDTYDDDFSTTDSLGSAFVFDLWTDKIVAEFTGRPHLAAQFYEIVRKLAIYYNAQVNYENNKKGLWQYFKNANSLLYLMETPEILKEKELIKARGHGNTSYGTPATKQVNRYALQLQAEWLQFKAMTNYSTQEEIPEEEAEKTNLDRVRSVGYLDECMKWNEDGNFDRVSAMGMVMIAREDRKQRVESSMNTRIKRKSRDPFLKKIFNRGRNNSQTYLTSLKHLTKDLDDEMQ